MKIEPYLADKRRELIWALKKQQYTDAQISRIFGMNRSSVMRIAKDMPRDWTPKWIKRT